MVRVQRELTVDADRAFEVFCDVQALPRWVPGMASVETLARHPNGRPSRVRFFAEREAGERVSYTLQYAYDLPGRRIMWSPPDAGAKGLRGFAHFEPIETGRCRMLYVIDAVDDADAALDAFESFLGTSA